MSTINQVNPAMKNWFDSVIYCPYFTNGQLPEGHPCREICECQYDKPLSDRQVPEPYNGNPITSRLIFISSNPSIGDNEDNPTTSWDYNDIWDFFNERFNPLRPNPVDPYVWHEPNTYKYYPRYKPETGVLKPNATHPVTTRDYSKLPVTFWRNAAKIADLLLGQGATLQDCLLTELVHCKSKEQTGVHEAMCTCFGKFFGGFLDMITKVHKVDSEKEIVMVVTGKETISAINCYALKANYAFLVPNQIAVWVVNNRKINLIPAAHLSDRVTDPNKDGAGFLKLLPGQIAHIKSII